MDTPRKAGYFCEVCMISGDGRAEREILHQLDRANMSTRSFSSCLAIRDAAEQGLYPRLLVVDLDQVMDMMEFKSTIALCRDHCPVVAVTSMPTKDQRDRALRYGCVEYSIKPLSELGRKNLLNNMYQLLNKEVDAKESEEESDNTDSAQLSDTASRGSSESGPTKPAEQATPRGKYTRRPSSRPPLLIHTERIVEKQVGVRRSPQGSWRSAIKARDEECGRRQDAAALEKVEADSPLFPLESSEGSSDEAGSSALTDDDPDAVLSTPIATPRAPVPPRNRKPGSSRRPAAKQSPPRETIIDKIQKFGPLEVVVCMYTKYNLVQTCVDSLGWVKGHNEDFDLLWADGTVNTSLMSKINTYRRVNHFPGMTEITRKDALSKNLRLMERNFPKEYNFHPETWILPDELKEFRENHKLKRGGGKRAEKGCFIVKPDNSGQGKGIYLATGPEQIGSREDCVVQRYIKKPFLIDGFKFDLRLYVLVNSVDPLRVFLHTEGLVRFCTERYKKPHEDNLDDLYMHLTNYAINKNNENYVHNSDAHKASEGSKWSLHGLQEWLDSHGHDTAKMWMDIEKVIIKTLIAVQPRLAQSYHTAFAPPGKEGSNGVSNDVMRCFEVLGFDVLLDHNLKPWLLEVNSAPSFRCDTPIDHQVKQQVILDTLNMVNLEPFMRKKSQQASTRSAAVAASQQQGGTTPRSRRFVERGDGRTTPRGGSSGLGGGGGVTTDDDLPRQVFPHKREEVLETAYEYEQHKMGGYLRIYPTDDNVSDYDRMLAAAYLPHRDTLTTMFRRMLVEKRFAERDKPKTSGSAKEKSRMVVQASSRYSKLVKASLAYQGRMDTKLQNMMADTSLTMSPGGRLTPRRAPSVDLQQRPATVASNKRASSVMSRAASVAGTRQEEFKLSQSNRDADVVKTRNSAAENLTQARAMNAISMRMVNSASSRTSALMKFSEVLANRSAVLPVEGVGSSQRGGDSDQAGKPMVVWNYNGSSTTRSPRNSDGGSEMVGRSKGIASFAHGEANPQHETINKVMSEWISTHSKNRGEVCSPTIMSNNMHELHHRALPRGSVTSPGVLTMSRAKTSLGISTRLPEQHSLDLVSHLIGAAR